MEEQNVQVAKRPAFLTVLCILTYIGSGLGVLFNLLGIFGIGAMSSFMSAYGVEGDDTGTLKLVLMLLISIGSILGAVLSTKVKFPSAPAGL